jgi:hypothetical protein
MSLVFTLLLPNKFGWTKEEEMSGKSSRTERWGVRSAIQVYCLNRQTLRNDMMIQALATRDNRLKVCDCTMAVL